MYYFAYGSNMSDKRLLQRVNATKINIGKLVGYQLKFHKVGSRDGTGKCDIFFTGHSNDVVLGVVYEIAKEDIGILDSIEGVGRGYESKSIIIEMDDVLIRAIGYVATNIDEGLHPLDWYKKHVLRGAKENGIDEAYIGMIESVSDIIDTNEKRKKERTEYL